MAERECHYQNISQFIWNVDFIFMRDRKRLQNVLVGFPSANFPEHLETLSLTRTKNVISIKVLGSYAHSLFARNASEDYCPKVRLESV